MFSVFMGMGYQIFVLVWLFIATLMIGFANVFFRPYLFFLTFIYSACTSWVNGFVTAKIMKSFGGTEWCFAAVSAITVFPLYVVGIFVAVDLIEFWKMSSSRTAPFTVIGIGILWLIIAVPLCCFGAQRAFASEISKPNIRVNQLRRKIPEMPTILKRRFAFPIFGALIFGSVFGEF
jgi:apolipoprotein N-acyltransferase